MQQQQTSARLACVWGVISMCLAVVGCSGGDFDGVATEPEIGEVDEALVTCQGPSCDGLPPGQCKNDMIGDGPGATIVDAKGKTIGGIGLFRSPGCQTIWATTAFYTSGAPRNFKVCAVKRRPTDNDSSCQDYIGQYGNDSPMKYAPSGKVVFGRTVVDGIATRTPDWTVP